MTRTRSALQAQATVVAAAGLAVLAALGGCSDRQEATKAPIVEARENTLTPLGTAASAAAPASAPTPAADASALPDRWLGQWNGPEGTFLKLAGGQGRYDISIQNLDGPRTFTGRAAGQLIEFERDGRPETLRATDGQATGMKWLDGKKDCLTVRAGEGYCRD
jgi:hypothetical protein